MYFIDEDYPFLKLVKIIRDVGSRTLSNVLYCLYQEHPFSKKGTVPSKEFCSKLNNKKFGKISKEKISALNDGYKFEVNESEPSKLDVSALFSILSEMSTVREKCEGKKKKKSNENCQADEQKMKRIEETNELLKKYDKKFENVLIEVKGVKDIRNELSHSVDNNITLLHSLKTDFDDCLIVLYTEMVSVGYREQFKDLLKNAQKETSDIWEAQLNVDERKSLILELQEDDVKKFISTSKKELIKKYERFKILIPSFLSQESFNNLNLDEIFTPVELYTNKKSLEYQSILTHNSEKKTTSPPAVVISGNAGFGKTTICRKLTNDWCLDKLSPLKDACHYDLLLHIEAKKAKQNSLVDYLKNILLPETQNELKYHKDDIIAYLAQCNILFIIDGYDEKSEDASKLLDEIMEYFPQKKFLISTRPHYLKQIFNSLRQNHIMYLDVNVQGFKKENRNIFIDKVWSQIKSSEIDYKDAENFKRYLEHDIGENLGELINIPLILLIILHLYISGKCNFKSIRNITLTKLYGDIFDLIKKKVIAAMTENSDHKTFNTIESNIEKLIIDLAYECYKIITLTNASSVDRSLFKNIRKKINSYFEGCSPLQIEIIYTSLFLYNPSLQKKDVSKMSDTQLADHLEFLHRTQIEYLAALHIFNEMHSPVFDDKLLETLFNNEHPNSSNHNFESVFGVTSFLVGLLSDENDLQKKYFPPIMDNVLKILYDYKEKYVICWKILYETKQYNNDFLNFFYDKNISDRLLSIFNKSKWELHSYEAISGLQLLANTEIKIGQLVVNIPESMCTFDIPNFIHIISQLKSSLKLRYNKNNPLMVEFHFSGDLQKGTDPNDLILKALNPWGHLEKFTGLLGEEAAATLTYCYKLTNLNARFITKRALQDCIVALKDKRCLKRFNLYIYVNQGESLDGYVELNVSKQAKVSVLFDGAVKENLSCISDILKKLKPKDQLFHTVSLLRTNLHHLDVNELIPTVKLLVNKKFTVHSTKDMDDKERLRIATSINNCEFEWLS